MKNLPLACACLSAACILVLPSLALAQQPPTRTLSSVDVEAARVPGVDAFALPASLYGVDR